MLADLSPLALFLFVPADRPERWKKAFAAGADAVILDLEDAVVASAKPDARRALREGYDQSPRRRVPYSCASTPARATTISSTSTP